MPSWRVPVADVVDVNPSPVRPGWLADPLGPPGRLRWWDGARWTARVAPLGEEHRGLAWRPELSIAPPPEAGPDSEAPVRTAQPTVPTAPRAGPIAPPEPEARLFGISDPLVAAFGADATWPTLPLTDAGPGPRRRHAVTALAAGAVLALGAGAGAIITDGGRPAIERTTRYRDLAADFSLRYPDAWRIHDEVGGTSVRFEVGAKGAPLIRTNLVIVRVGDPTEAPLSSLDSLAASVTQAIRTEFPDIRLEEAGEARLLGSPARRFQLADMSEQPPVRILQYIGTTTTGRPLTVTVTVREPRTAPTPAQVREFIRSLAPA